MGGIVGYALYKEVMLMDLKNKTAEEVCDLVMHHSKSISEDEWFEINNWITEFLKSDAPKEKKKLLGPLGPSEITCMICDGITRWRESICYRCKRKRKKFCCEIYPGSEDFTNRIPSEIWSNDDAKCSFFEPEKR